MRFATKVVALVSAIFMLNPIQSYAEPKNNFILNGENYSLTYITESSGIYLYSTKEEEIPKHIIDAIENAGISNEMDDVKKANKIAEYLCNVLTYDEGTTKFTKDNYIPFTDWCLTTGDAVCAGYADSFQRICTALGIECYYEVGHTYNKDGELSEYHAWNRIVVDGIDYWYDVCWLDSSMNKLYKASNIRWDDRVFEEEWFRYRVNGSLYPSSEEN